MVSQQLLMLLALLVIVLQFHTLAAKKQNSLLLLSTTSTENSGLLEYLLPKFKADSGIQVHVVALGTGQAIRAAERGDGDLLMVHDKASEAAFVAEGYGINRRPFMVNDFVIVGPRYDPLKIKGLSIYTALRRIDDRNGLFLSRGDDSGTHKKEIRLWHALGINPRLKSGESYREVGAGMGRTLNMAASLGAYTLADRGTWLGFNNRRDLQVLVEGDPPLLNQYSVIEINPQRHPHVKSVAARVFADWLVSEAGQTAIGAFRIDDQILFVPNFGEPEYEEQDNLADDELLEKIKANRPTQVGSP